jgi:DNA-binding MarR family transcriptional regulator
MAKGPNLLQGLVVGFVLFLLVLAFPTNTMAVKGPPAGFTREIRVTFDAEQDYFPTTVVDLKDNIHMFWLNGTSRDIDNMQVQNGRIYYAKYSPYGDVMVPPTDLKLGAKVDQDFVTTPLSVGLANADSKIYLTWSDNRVGNFHVYFARMDLDGNVESQAVSLQGTGNSEAKYPDLAVDTEGNVHIAWAQWEMLGTESIYPEIYYEKVLPTGDTIIQRIAVTNTYLASNHPSIAVDKDLNAHIVFEENVNFPGSTDELYYCIVDSQGHLKVSMERVTITSGGYSLRPDIALDRDETLHIVWERHEGDESDVYFTEIQNGLTTDALQVSNLPKAYSPRLVIDSGKDTHIVWSQNIYSHIADNSQIMYAVVDSDGTISTDPMFLTYGALGAKAPAIALDGYTNVIVAWDDYRADPKIGINVWDIYYMRNIVGVNLEPVDLLQVNGANIDSNELKFYVGDEAVFYAGNSTDPNPWDEILQYNFTIVHTNETFYSGWDENSTLRYKFHEAGDYLVYVKVKDSFGYKNSRPHATLIKVTEKPKPASIPMMENPRIRTTVVASGIGITATLGYLIAGTELGKYHFASLLLVPLYSRIKRENTLDNYIRGQIHGYVLAKPGCHYNQIKQTLHLNNGTLAYHLRKLEREEFIKSVRDGMYKRFYPVGLKIPKREIKLSAMQDHILEIIRHHPGVSQKEVATEVGISAPAVIYHIGVLSGAKLVRSEKVGSRMEYRAIERPEDEWELPADSTPAGSGH